MIERNPGLEPGSTREEGMEEKLEKPRVLKPATPEEMAFLESFLKDHPEAASQKEVRRDCEKEKGELQRLIEEYSNKHSLEKLNAVIDVSPDLYNLLAHYKRMTAEEVESASASLTPEDANNFRTRVSAKDDLAPIVALLNILEKETNITGSDLDKLTSAYKVLSRAVGMINNGKVDHTR
jgi:hypothetical protein